MSYLPALIGAGASLLGGVLGNQASADNTAAANAQSAANVAASNQANRDIAREQMEFQERMSNSAYQRAMADMGRAGLNPILAYSQGGASTPSGASISAQSAPVSTPNYQDPFGPAVHAGFDAFSKTEQVRQAAAGLGIQAANSEADIALKAAQAAATTSSAKKTQTEARILESRAKKEKLEGDWYSTDHGKTLWQLNRINEAVGGSIDSISSARDLLNPFSALKKLRLNKNMRGKGMLKDGTQFDVYSGEVIP